MKQIIAFYVVVVFLALTIFFAILFELKMGYPIGKTSKTVWSNPMFFVIYFPVVGIFIAASLFTIEQANKIHAVARTIKWFFGGICCGLLCIVIVALFLRLIGVMDDQSASNVPAIIRFSIFGFLLFTGMVMVRRYEDEIVRLWTYDSPTKTQEEAAKAERVNAFFKDPPKQKAKQERRPPPPPPPPSDELTNALALFELEQPFTAKELSERRRVLVKKLHPDRGGSAHLFKQVEAAHEVLKPLSKG